MFFNPSCISTIRRESFFISSHSYSKYAQLIIFNTIILQPCVYIPINQLRKSIISLYAFAWCWITHITLNKYQNKCKYLTNIKILHTKTKLQILLTFFSHNRREINRHFFYNHSASTMREQQRRTPRTYFGTSFSFVQHRHLTYKISIFPALPLWMIFPFFRNFWQTEGILKELLSWRHFEGNLQAFWRKFKNSK